MQLNSMITSLIRPQQAQKKELNRRRCRLGFGLGWSNAQGSILLGWGAHWHHLAITIEPFMCGGDATCLTAYY